MAEAGGKEPGTLFSVRMRASAGAPHEEGGRHVSGAERILPEGEVGAAVLEMLARALHHSLGRADHVHIAVDRLPAAVRHIPGLSVTTLSVAGVDEARATARELLELAGVAGGVAQKAVALLAAGPAPGGVSMRGAVVMDAMSGERREPDPARGVRASRVDLSPKVRQEAAERLAAAGLVHHRVGEAVVLAAKVAWAGTLAELCWSDDPDYTTGYVASPVFGYVRIPSLKPAGDRRGGRVFFVPPGTDIAAYIARLEGEPVLAGAPGPIRGSLLPADFIREVRHGHRAAARQ